jgi:catechol 2,3-dioxygenase-like lactoylglutathione lyase family enzyme
MELNHIALTVTNHQEITDFYQDILGFQTMRVFELEEQLSEKIFGISTDVAVAVLTRDELSIEVFVSNTPVIQGFGHICLNVDKRGEIIRKAKAMSYKVISIDRGSYDLIFIKDKNGNLIELKEKG